MTDLPTLEVLAILLPHRPRRAVREMGDESLPAARPHLRVVRDGGEAVHVPHADDSRTVVAAVVTSDLGVLAGRRRDGRPLWAFVGGKVEPGETPARAAVREVEEETGLKVLADDGELGRRVHPVTGRMMIYVACTPAAGNEVRVAAPDELAEVRWLTLRDVDELLLGVVGPVREYLACRIP